ncbi:type 1 fimbrial protein [Shewanella sp. M16]|uniref:fimbrial protein n=1 Tax=Shewanella sp. M16 TaxID=2830837 RepID=UPI001BB08384|nr:fimbrial protein [Shewanella sp. M16]MBS0041125.1 type 1 fimbrial protein [Shewanella sp. M16]
MKKLTLSVLVLSGLFAANAQANNTITFQGEVSDETCEVAINGNTGNQTVLLPTIPATALAAVSATAGETSFTISVSGCSAAASALPIDTVFVGSSVTSNGNLGNTGSAQGVSIQLLDAVAGSPVDLTNGASVTGLNVAIGETSASHDFAVQYYAEDATVIAGSVISSVQYAISYQ